MATFSPKKIDLTSINNGLQFESGDGISPEAINAPIEASAFIQSLAENKPYTFSNGGEVSVSIGETPEETPVFVFENLASEQELQETQETVRNLEAYTEHLDDLIASKQDQLTIDTAITESSENPVSSGAVYEALQAIGGGGGSADGEVAPLPNTLVLRDENGFAEVLTPEITWGQALDENQAHKAVNVGTLDSIVTEVETELTGQIGGLRLELTSSLDRISLFSKSGSTQGSVLIAQKTDAKLRIPISSKAVHEALVPLQDHQNEMQADIDMLYTLVEGTVVAHETIEDTFATRTTGGGIAVIDNTPTTVQKVQGTTKVVRSNNLINLAGVIGTGKTVGGITVTADNNTLTFKGANTETYSSILVTMPLYLEVGKTYTLTQNYNFETEPVGIMAEVYSEDGNVYVTTGATTDPVQFTYESGLKFQITASVPDGTIGNEVDYTISFMLNEGDTALPYEPYVSELVNSTFGGIRSTGKNFANMEQIIGGQRISKNGITVVADSNILRVSGTVYSSYTAFPSVTNPIHLETGKTYTFYQTEFVTYGNNAAYFGVTVTRVNRADGTGKWMGNTAQAKFSFKVEEGYDYRFGVVTNYFAVGTVIDLVIPYVFHIGKEDIQYEPYSYVDYSIPEPVELGKWDYIDVENQQIVRHTYTIDFADDVPYSYQTPNATNFVFTIKGLPVAAAKQVMASHYTYGAGADKTIHITVSATQTTFIIQDDSCKRLNENGEFDVAATRDAYKAHFKEIGLQVAIGTANPISVEPISCPSSYTAYSGGTETIIGGDEATVTQEYYVKVGG